MNDAAATLERLQGYLELDPGNAGLLTRTAEAALAAREFGTARALLTRARALAGDTPELRNLSGRIDLGSGDLTSAAQTFAGLIDEGWDAPAVRFNLAWTCALQGDFQSADDVLDERSAAASDTAAALKVGALHHLGRLAEAMQVGARLGEAGRTGDELKGAMAAVALDLGDLETAKLLAGPRNRSQAGLTVQGSLELAEHRAAAALERFDAALALNPDGGRAELGRGLALAALGETAPAADAVERAAARLEGHVGSWVAAGWLRYAVGDLPAARAAFERALALDDSFAESQGALAVVELAEGRVEEARRRAQLAQRLDRRSLGAALAASFLRAHDGDAAGAERIRNLALETPVGAKGETLAQALAMFGLDRRGPR
jgi:tetratricopeptide (TPR) repeat protein